MSDRHSSKLFGAADLAMITTCLLWGLGAVVVKSAIGDTLGSFRVFVFNGLRMPLVSAFLFAGLKLSGCSAAIRREHIPYVALVSFFGMFLHIVASLTGLSLTTASNMGIILATIPLFILAVSFATGTERPTGVLVAGILIGMTGMLTLTWQNGEFNVHKGDFLILASCMFWAIYTVYSKKLVSAYNPVVVIAWVFFFATIYQLPLFFYQLKDQSFASITPLNWFYFGIATVGSYAIANSLYVFALHRIGPIRVGIYSNLSPVFTVILAYLIRGETVTMLKVLGLLVILAGIGITKIGPSVSSEPEV